MAEHKVIEFPKHRTGKDTREGVLTKMYDDCRPFGRPYPLAVFNEPIASLLVAAAGGVSRKFRSTHKTQRQRIG